MLPHSPALLSVTRNSGPQLKMPKLSLKQLQNNSDLVGRVRLSSQERSVLWETSLSWDVSHRRFGSLSQEPTAGKAASLLLLKLLLVFPPKVLWPCEPPPCPAVTHSTSSRMCSQDRDRRSSHHPAHLDCTSVQGGLAKDSVDLGCWFLPQEWQGTPRTAQMQENTLEKSYKPILPIACHYLILRQP